MAANASVASSAAFASGAEYIINRFLLPPTVIFGLIGNTLNLIILGNRKARTSSAMVMLIAMSVLDLLNLLIQLPHLVCNEYRYIMHQKYYLVFQRNYYSFVMYPWANTMTTGVALLSAAVALDRFAAIKNVRPLYRVFHKHSTSVTAGIVISSLLVNIGKHFELRPIPDDDPSPLRNVTFSGFDENATLEANATLAIGGLAPGRRPKHELMVTSVIDSDVYRYLSYWGFGTIQVLLPMTIMIIFGGIVVVTFIQIRSHQKKTFGQERARKDGNSSDKISFATRMVIATIVVFVLCNWTSVVLIAAVAASGRVILTQSLFFASLRHINNYLTVAHSSINFLLYCTTCAQYRSALRRLFSCSSKQQPLARVASNAGSRLVQHTERQPEEVQCNAEDGPTVTTKLNHDANCANSLMRSTNGSELVPLARQCDCNALANNNY